MAYFYKDGSGIDSSAYIYVQLQVTRTDYPTYSRFSVKSVAVSDTGSSSFIRGQVTTNQGGTSWTAATGWKSVSYNGTTTLATATFDVTRGASDKTAHIGAYAEGGGTGIYAGGTDYAWLNVTVPKVLAPNAPTGCTATYVSDSQASVSWTNGTTDSDHPRDATLVERRDGSNDWAQVASASGTASGYTDNGISANTQYQYRVRAKNVAGYSAYSTSGSIYTTPAAPASVTLDKTAATTVQVDVTGTWGYSVTYDIESTYDGGSTWASVATSTSLPYSATVNAGTVQFRVRAVRGSLSSAWTLSASLVTITPPLAPTIVQAPANPTSYGDSDTIVWSPNHPDGSAQASAEIKVTNPGGTSTTYTVTTATSYQLTPNATGTWTAQVRTKGLDPSYGEWSQSVSWAVANPPAVIITSPATDGADVSALPLDVEWSVTDSTGVSTQRVIIEGDGGEIINRTLAGDVRTLSLTASDVDLTDGETYTIRIRVMGGSGLVTEQTRIFDVAWLAPAAPVLQLTEGEGRSATIDVMDTRYTSSGTVLEASSAMMESLTIHGKSVQDGTPSPSSPVPIESIKSPNLFDQSAAIAGYLNANGTISGPTANNEMTSDYIPVTAGEDVGVYLVTEVGYAAWLCFMCFNADKSVNTVFLRSVANQNYAMIDEMPAGAAYVRVSARHLSTGKAQLYISRGRAYYANPYVGPTELPINANGGNLLKPHARGSVTSGGLTSSVDADGTIHISDTASGVADVSIVFDTPIMFEAGKSYTVSMTSAGTRTGALTVLLRKDSINYYPDIPIAVGNTSATFTPSTTGTVNFMLLRTTSGNSITLSAKLSIYEGTETTYTGPQGTVTNIDLQGHALRSLPDGTRDELRVEGGNAVLVKRVGSVVFDGSSDENWHVESLGTAGSNFYIAVSDAAHGTYGDRIMLTLCQACTRNVAQTDRGFISNGGNLNLTVGGTLGVSTVADFRTWLATNPVTVLYPLATPQEIDLGAVSLPYVDGSAWVDAEVTPNIEATFRPVDFPDQPTIQSVDVQRVNAAGTAWTVATGLTVGGSCIDPLPPLGVPVTYRATSSAASGSTASGEFTETFGGRGWALNFGNAAQEHVEFIYNPQADLSLAQGGKGYHFADGGAGNGLPVFYPTTDRDYAGTLKFDTILYGDSDKVLDLCDRYPVAWLRDPFGHRWRAHVAPSVSHGVGQVWPVTLSWDAVRWTEAWDG